MFFIRSQAEKQALNEKKKGDPDNFQTAFLFSMERIIYKGS